MQVFGGADVRPYNNSDSVGLMVKIQMNVRATIRKFLIVDICSSIFSNMIEY